MRPYQVYVVLAMRCYQPHGLKGRSSHRFVSPNLAAERVRNGCWLQAETLSPQLALIWMATVSSQLVSCCPVLRLAVAHQDDLETGSDWRRLMGVRRELRVAGGLVKHNGYQAQNRAASGLEVAPSHHSWILVIWLHS